MKLGGQPTPWSETETEGLRLRSVSQILIQEIGADGPENAEDSARRACGVIQRQADQIVSADARIAELERECSQWREELRIYRETESARIAELEQSVTVRDTEIARLETDLELARMDVVQLKSLLGDCREIVAWERGELSNDPRGREDEYAGLTRVLNAIDAARANGGES